MKTLRSCGWTANEVIAEARKGAVAERAQKLLKELQEALGGLRKVNASGAEDAEINSLELHAALQRPFRFGYSIDPQNH